MDLINSMGGSAQKALDFVEKIIAGPLIEGTGIFTDKVQYWRFKNKVNTILKAILKAKGIDIPKKIPIKDLSTLLDYASFEDDDNMQDSWAKLLANAMDPNNAFNSCNVFSHILNQLSVNEIFILKHIYVSSFIRSNGDRPYLSRTELIKNSQSTYETGQLLIDNLLRLRLIEEEPPTLSNKSRSAILYNQGEEIPDNEIIVPDRFRISFFGSELMNQILK
jgi:hypothetical protein